MPRFQKRTDVPRVSLSGARAAYFGPGLDLAPHRNAAATVAVALEVPFALTLPAHLGVSPEQRRIALIPPNTVHHLQAPGPMAFIYLDALSSDHRRLRRGDLEADHDALLGAGGAALDWDVDAWVSALGVPARGEPDPRLASVIRELDDRPQDFHHVGDAAKRAGLSPSRFQALFVAAVGVPFRRYRLWRRMAIVMRALSQQRSLTDAAHEAGFSSSAHLSSSFREMFGLAPSRLVALGVRIEIAAARETSCPALAGGTPV